MLMIDNGLTNEIIFNINIVKYMSLKNADAQVQFQLCKEIQEGRLSKYKKYIIISIIRFEFLQFDFRFLQNNNNSVHWNYF